MRKCIHLKKKEGTEEEYCSEKILGFGIKSCSDNYCGNYEEENIPYLADFTGTEEEYEKFVQCLKTDNHICELSINLEDGSPIIECKNCDLIFAIRGVI